MRPSAQNVPTAGDPMYHALAGAIADLSSLLERQDGRIEELASVVARLTGGSEAATPEATDPLLAVAPGPLSYNKVCNVEDFLHPELTPFLHQAFPDHAEAFGPGWPAGNEFRKVWEIAMTMRTFCDFGVLNDQAEILGVGAGRERTIFLLTEFVRRVFATDLYCAAGSWVEDATDWMLRDPRERAPIPFNRNRLVVQHMDALELAYDDNSFDGLFSSSSIEHFGTLEDVARAAREMHRVLKPGGILSLSTEFRIDGPGPGIPGVLLLDPDQLQDAIVGDLDWSLVSAPDLSVGARTRDEATSFPDIIARQQQGFDDPPHVALTDGTHTWTSVHLALQKGLPATD